MNVFVCVALLFPTAIRACAIIGRFTPSPLTLYGLYGTLTRISVLNSAKKGVYFKDFAGPRFHENRGIFSIQTSSVISVSHVLNMSWLF